MSVEQDYVAHESAIIDMPVKIGQGTRIGPFTHVMTGAVIGRNCVLGQNVHIAGRARLGDNVNVHNNVSICDGVELEHDVFCGPSAVFMNSAHPRANVDSNDELRTIVVRQGASVGANATVMCGITIGQYAFVAAGATVTRDVPEYALVMGVPARSAGWVCRCGQTLQLVNHQAQCGRCESAYQLVDGLLSPVGELHPCDATPAVNRIIGPPSDLDILLPA